MRISLYLDQLLDDLGDLEPISLSDIVRFVRSHETYSSIIMLAKNGKKSSVYFYEQCECILEVASDIHLAGLLVLAADTNDAVYDKLASRTSKGAGNLYWSQAMAASYLLHKEVLNDRVRKSA